jgi:dTDP-glucose 4,6-dehydratase
MNVID